jgi:hypothetical protein
LVKIKIHIFLGSTELTDSKFHNCPNTRPYSRRVPIWGWIAISVGSAILLLIVLGIIFKFIRKSRSNGGLKKKSLSEPRQQAEKGNNNSLLIHDFSPS